MKTVDLSKYNLAELKGLQHDIEQQIKSRQQQDVRKAREQIMSIAQDLGISIEDLMQNASGKGKGSTGQKVLAQYKNPADESLTWTGRGRQPRWVVDALANGKTLDDLRI
jgi:DNA-binding protein H-NS